MNIRKRGCRIGFDIGGTFTDFVLLETPGGRLHTHKALTTAADPAAGSVLGLDALVAKAGMTFADIDDIVHGTTIVTNAVIERRGACTALLTTRGFRDILEMGTEQRYDAHDLFIRFPEPLVERSRRFEIDERIAADGSIVVPISPDDVRAMLSVAVASGAEAIAVSFLHAYKNDVHERLVASIAAEEFPGLLVSLSSQVCAEVREYERATTTSANAYVMPLIDPYVSSIERALQERGFSGSLYLMQSSGLLASPEMARRFPVRLLESGPAGGAIAAGYFGRLAGHDDVIAFDMGGTTAKVCLIEDGRADIAPMIEAAREHRFKRGSGLPIRAPVIDMIEIGAGGGSIASFDDLGLVKVGPRSAGSTPGPACYGRGGELPTVTDANLVMGYLNEGSFLGGRMRLDKGAAKQAFSPIASRLEADEVSAAWGVLAVVCENMAGAARAHIVEKGRDPRGFTMVAFGGAGPAHAIRVAKSLGMAKVVVPQASGVASALGFLGGRVGHEAVRSAPGRLSDLDWASVTDLLGELEADGRLLVAEAGVAANSVEIARRVELRLAGQVHNIQVAVPDGRLDESSVPVIYAAFARQYRQLYEREPSNSDVEVISWRVTALGPDPRLSLTALVRQTEGRNAFTGARPVWFPETGTFVETSVYDRYSLSTGDVIHGPAVIEEEESTTIVPPGDRIEVDTGGNLVVHLSHGAVARKQRQAGPLSEQIADLENDSIGLEIMWSRLVSISEESWLTVIRTAFSLIIGEMQDFACEILDGEGQPLAHSPRAMPVFNVTLASAVKALLNRFPVETLQPGDVLITNDPWLCAGHLFDIAIVTPVFRDGQVVAMTGSVGHVSDIGGTKDRMRAREIFEEGIQIPPMKLYRAGEPNRDLFEIIENNVRNPAQVLGDIEALVAANAVGARRLETFMQEYGLYDLRALATVIQSRAEQAMRQAIRAVPDGVYYSQVQPLSNGVRQTFPVKVTVSGDEIEIDYDGAPAELSQGGLNCTFSFTEAETFFALKCLLTPSIRASAGCYRPLTVKAPEGSMLNCSRGTSVGLRHLNGSFIVGNVFQALGQAMPDLVQAFSGPPAIIHFFGKDEKNRSFSEHLYLGGGQGASMRQDGHSSVLWPTSASNGSVEVLETRAPVLVVEKAYVPESAGSGRTRAGLGQQLQARRIRPGEAKVMVNCYPEGVGFVSTGMEGGAAGGTAHFRMYSPTGELLKDYGSGSVDTLSATDQVVEVRVGGGSGCGNPIERPLEQVLADVRDGYVSIKQAQEDYGVVLNQNFEVDHEATASKRGLARLPAMESRTTL